MGLESKWQLSSRDHYAQEKIFKVKHHSMRNLKNRMPHSGGNVGVFVGISKWQQCLRLDGCWHVVFSDFWIKQSCKFTISHGRKQMDLVLRPSMTRDIDDFHVLLQGHAKHLTLYHPLEYPSACVSLIAR